MTPQERRDALKQALETSAAGAGTGNPPDRDDTLAALNDRTQTSDIRRGALQLLAAASFETVGFAPFRAQFMASMRAILHDDSSPDGLYRDALTTLALEADGLAQTTLERALRNPETARISAADALHILAADDHANAAAAARLALENSDDPAARTAALRVLASDTSAAPLLANIFADSAQPIAMRRVAAQSLQQIDRDAFATAATALAANDAEDPGLRASATAALSNIGATTDTTMQDHLRDIVARLAATAKID